MRFDGPYPFDRSERQFSVEQAFAEPLSRDADLLAILAQLTRNLCAILERRGRGARRLEACFFPPDGAVRSFAIGTGAPLRDADRLYRLLAEKFATLHWQDEFGYERIRLAVLRTEWLDASQRDFLAGDEGVELNHLIDRLSARLGPARVLAFLPQDTHIPEQAVVTIPAQSAREFDPHPSRVRGSTSPFQGEERLNRRVRVSPHDTLALPRPIRMLEGPEAIETMAEIPDGAPLRFRWRGAHHQVAHAEGPERIAMPWWHDSDRRALTRDYFRIETAGGMRLWLYREGLWERETARPRWFVHGFLP